MYLASLLLHTRSSGRSLLSMGEINNDNSFVFDTFAFNYSNDVVQNQQAMKQKGEKAKKDLAFHPN